MIRLRTRAHWLALLSVAALLSAVPVRTLGAAPDIMPPSEVKAGMRGYGLTVFDGVEPERFEVEVLGVLRNALPKGDMILVRMSHPVLDEAGGLAGMSGSPVYLDDRLVGAVAFGWRYCKIPLAGLTPIGDMMRVRQMGGEEAAPDGGAKLETARQLRLRSRELADLLLTAERSEDRDRRVHTALARMVAWPLLGPRASGRGVGAVPAAVSALLPAGADPQMRPLPIPLAIGADAPAADLFPMLEGVGFLPVQAADAAAAPPGPRDERPPGPMQLKPGMPVGASFISGDLDVSGTGTLTVVDGDAALAFGHELIGSGATDIPLVAGEVQAVVPSLAISFRLTSAGPVIGRIVQDRSTGILAKLGEEAPTFPCRVRIKGAVEEEYSYRIAGHWRTAPMFTEMALDASSSRWEAGEERHTLAARLSISVKDRQEPIVRQNVYATTSVMAPAMDLGALAVEALVTNPYREVEITGVDYELEVIPGFQAALIESAWADRAEAKPGSEVNVYVRLIEYRGEELVKKLRLKIPETAEPGSRVEILVCDALINRSIKRGLDPGLFAPRSFEHVVRVLEEMESNRNLVMRASFFEEGVRYAGGAMPALPPSALSILRHNGTGGRAAPLRTDVVQSVETPWVLEGSQSLFITIEEPETYKP